MFKDLTWFDGISQDCHIWWSSFPQISSSSYLSQLCSSKPLCAFFALQISSLSNCQLILVAWVLCVISTGLWWFVMFILYNYIKFVCHWAWTSLEVLQKPIMSCWGARNLAPRNFCGWIAGRIERDGWWASRIFVCWYVLTIQFCGV